jgi:hypothetical protein
MFSVDDNMLRGTLYHVLFIEFSGSRSDGYSGADIFGKGLVENKLFIPGAGSFMTCENRISEIVFAG